MNFKCFKRRFRSNSVLTRTIPPIQSFKMQVHVSIIILLPIFTCLWVYFLILVVDSFTPKQSIEIKTTEENNIRNITQNMFPLKNKNKSDVSNKKKSFHVPKFMLELYENNKVEGKKMEGPDVVRSVIPTHSGK